MHLPKIYIVVLNYKTWQDTIECLESVLKIDYDNFHVVVIDNHSPNDSWEKMLEWANGNISAKCSSNDSRVRNLVIPFSIKPLPYQIYLDEILNVHSAYDGRNKLVFIRLSQNRGYASGNNVGIKYALSDINTEYVLILNNDTVVSSSLLRNLVCEFDAKNAKFKLGLLGCKVKFYHFPDIIQCLGGATYNRWLGIDKQIGRGFFGDSFLVKNLKLDCIIGASVFFSRGILEDVGLMSEDYFLYFEELDYAERSKRKGWSLDYAENAIVYHKEGSTISGNKNEKSELSDFYYLRSKILFTLKYYGFLNLIMVYIFSLATLIKRLQRKQYSRIPMLIKVLLNPSRRYKR